MITDYADYEKVLRSGTDKDISDLAELIESSPAIYRLYDKEYQSRHQQTQQKIKQRKRERDDKMFLTFSEYEKMLDTVGGGSLMNGDSNLAKISQFAREYPTQYASYRERLHKQQETKYKTLDASKGV